MWFHHKKTLKFAILIYGPMSTPEKQVSKKINFYIKKIIWFFLLIITQKNLRIKLFLLSSQYFSLCILIFIKSFEAPTYIYIYITSLKTA